MTETPLSMDIDMSRVVPASNCPHYITVTEQEGGARACVGCSLKLASVFSRLGQFVAGSVPVQHKEAA